MKTDKKKKKDRPGEWKASVKFRGYMAVKIYQLAKQGLADRHIAEAVGIDKDTLKKWKKDVYEVKYALEEGRKADAAQPQFRQYLYDRLPEHLKPVWDQVQRCETEPTALGQLEAMLRDAGSGGTKHLLLYAVVHYNFNLSKACRAVCMSRKKLERWAVEDPEFFELLQEVHSAKKDFFEEKLFELVKNGDAGAVMFVNKTVNADRGYNPGKSVKIEHEGLVKHSHSTISIDDLDLPLEERIRIREAFKAKRTVAITEGGTK